MKTNTSLLLSLLFIALTALKPHTNVAAESAPDPVRDIDGKILRSGVDYYILPVIRGRGGGLTMASVGKENCPLHIVQEQNELSNGLPLTFTPVNPKKGVIRVSVDHNIKFSSGNICGQSTLWNLQYDESAGRWVVGTGGVEGNPGKETLSNWFSIEKYEDDYKLVYCPTVCDFCKPVCGTVGIYMEDGYRRLALSDVPFKVMFKRA